jgi:hypothetical protein
MYPGQNWQWQQPKGANGNLPVILSSPASINISGTGKRNWRMLANGKIKYYFS